MDRLTYSKEIGGTVYVISTDTADKTSEECLKKKVEKMIRRSIEKPVIEIPLKTEK